MTKIFFISLGLLIAGTLNAAEGLQPYLLFGDSGQTVTETNKSLSTALSATGFEVLGEYSPAESAERSVLVISHPELLSALAALRPSAGFFSAIRIGLISVNGQTLISLQNPEYWGNAYLQDEYTKIESVVNSLKLKISNIILDTFPSATQTSGYGSSQNFTQDDLREYHYMFGMPYFEDNVLLGEFGSHLEAVAAIEKNLKTSTTCSKVFVRDLPGKEVRLYGIALKGETGEGQFVPIIDIGEQKHVTFLPYELLVTGKQVYMLHGRFRIALSFPDLTMGTFSKIMSTPGEIEDLLSSLTK
ncbi:MAG: hypothetical protein H8E38_06600 [SAR324 cluster bacterium]|nr:hypothetical protein [SAR324 cluster bacterium]MBL7034783.1 hypothetical protein [SAR324 cluster bacterium]